MSDPKQGDPEQNQTNPSGDIQDQSQQDQQEQDQQQGAVGGAVGNSPIERERVAAPESEDLYTVIIPKGKRTAAPILERKSPTPEPKVEDDEDLPPTLPPRTFSGEGYDDVGVSMPTVSSGIYQPPIVQDSNLYSSIGGVPQEAQYDAAARAGEPRRFLYGPYTFSNGQEIMDFEFDTPWPDVRNAVLGNKEIKEEWLTTSGPVRDIADRIVASKGNLPEDQVEEILDIIYMNESEIAEGISNPLHADVDNNPVKGAKNVMTLMHLVYACDTDPRIIKALGEVENDEGDLGANAYNVLDSEGNLPLHHAAKNCTGDKLKLCMEKTKSDFIDTANFDNQSPLHIITRKPDCSALDIEEFTSRNLDFGLVDGDGKNPLHHAVEHLPPVILKGVMDYVKSSTEFQDLVNDPDYLGNTIAHHAVKNQNADLTLFNMLKASGADLSVRNVVGRAPIHVASSDGKTNAVAGLVSCGIDVNSQDVNGDTPLHIAVEGGNMETVLAVLNQRGADVSVQNNDGVTPMLSAAKYGDIGVIKALGSAKPNIKGEDTVAKSLLMEDYKGFTPLHFVAGGGSRDTFRVVRKNYEKYHDLATIGAALMQNRSGGELVNLGDFESENILGSPNAKFLQHIQSANFGFSPAHCAIVSSNHNVIKDILNFVGDSLHLPSERGYNAMQVAALFGDKEAVKMLAKSAKPSDLNFKTSATLTPLNLACLRGDNEVVRGLVGQHGIDINQRMGSDKNTVLHYAISKGDSSLVRKILAHTGVDVNCENDLGQTPLHLAVEGGDPKIVSSLLKVGAVVNRLDDNGRSVLSSAIVPGRKEKGVLGIVNKLLDGGADIDLDGDHNILLDQCIRGGYNNVLDKLIAQGVEVNRNSEIRPMVYAAISGNEHAIKSLANAGGDVNEVVNNPSSRHSGNPLIMVAVADGNAGLLKTLVSEGCDVGKPGRDGNTALHCAVGHSDKNFGNKAIKILTSRNSARTNRDVLTQKNNAGDTPLHEALKSGNINSVQNILSAVHTRYAKEILTARDKEGYTPMHHTVGVNNVDVSRSILESMLSKGVNNLGEIVGAQDSNFQTPLHSAIKISDYRAADMMISRLSKTELSKLSQLTDINGDTPLHLSCQSGNVYMTQFFLGGLDKRELPKTLKIANKNGDTPLHDAIRNDDVKSAKMMIRNCSKEELANVLKYKDSFGNTVLHVIADQVIANPESKKGLDGLMNLAMRRLKSQDLKDLVNTRNNFGDTVAHCALLSDMKCAQKILKSCERDTLVIRNSSNQSLSECIRDHSKYKKGGIFSKSLFSKLKKLEARAASASYEELSSISSGSDVSSVSTNSTEVSAVPEVARSSGAVLFKHVQETGVDTSGPSDTESLSDGLSDTSLGSNDFDQRMADLDQEIANIVSGLPEVTQVAVSQQQAASPSSGQAAGVQQKEMQR
uniref:200-kDa immunoreactive protein n=1 Tax=Ehrlichia canis TaxID=944 RepID=D5L835_EHRCA|nr:200-kDa immunoreactive protein [Ehrlichia canis]ADI59553.1 200 kDa immunoreactive protein [Ehrlichia canis]ADI59554.1 200 kDa immunoreactive protein [Ehrlichia canis]